ncbi:hypothetical protein D3C78_1801530 [compost metagenome]
MRASDSDSMAFLSRAKNTSGARPASIGGRNFASAVPGQIMRLLRPQNRPELSATGTTGTLSSI